GAAFQRKKRGVHFHLSPPLHCKFLQSTRTWRCHIHEFTFDIALYPAGVVLRTRRHPQCSGNPKNLAPVIHFDTFPFPIAAPSRKSAMTFSNADFGARPKSPSFAGCTTPSTIPFNTSTRNLALTSLRISPASCPPARSCPKYL